MTININTVFNIQITRETAGVLRAGFGIPLILGTNAGWSERSRAYSTTKEILADGFSSSDPEYLAATAIFSQSPRVKTIRIGRQLAKVAQIQTLVISANFVASNVITVDVDGVTITQNFDTNNSTTLAALATQIQAEPGVATAISNGTTTITITSQNAGIPTIVNNFNVTGGLSQPTATITTTTDNHGPAEDLAEISDENDSWYGLISTDRNVLQVMETARYIETVRKIFITTTDDVDSYDSSSTTDLGALLFAKKYNRTAWTYNAEPNDFMDAALMGRFFPYAAGSANYAWKTLTGITADNLTTTQATNIKAKKGNIYVTIGGLDVVQLGTMASGEWIDIMTGIDALQADMEERLFGNLYNSLKVPFTDDGAAQEENQVRAALQASEDTNFLAQDPKFEIFTPKVKDVNPNDRKNRLFNGITFTARAAGAINGGDIFGTITT